MYQQDKLIDEIPMVSVCTITYGHEAFIKDTIEGVLMQEVEFEVEFIIADDCSPDNTAEIVKSYQENHPRGHWIKYTRHKENLGVIPNFVWALKACKGKYIALCEGDDYWTDPLKLQKQVNFLETNPEYVISFHDVDVIDKNGTLIKKGRIKNNNSERSQYDLIGGAHLPTPTTLFKNYAQELPNSILNVLNGDTFLFAFIGHKGKGYFDKSINNAIYRLHGGGVWSSQNTSLKIKNSINTFKEIKNVSDVKFHNIIDLKIARKYKQKFTQETKFSKKIISLLNTGVYFLLSKFK